jgi:hypothetical protein
MQHPLALPGHDEGIKTRPERHDGAAGVPVTELDRQAVFKCLDPGAAAMAESVAGTPGHATRSLNYPSIVPLAYDTTQEKTLRRMVGAGSAHLSSQEAPYATGEAAAPVLRSAVDGPIAAATASALAQDGAATKLKAAFAKRDVGRQGLLAPHDFASAMRELGVPLSARSLGLTHASCNLSSDTARARRAHEPTAS